jgi:hypothetical protein
MHEAEGCAGADLLRSLFNYGCALAVVFQGEVVVSLLCATKTPSRMASLLPQPII